MLRRINSKTKRKTGWKRLLAIYSTVSHMVVVVIMYLWRNINTYFVNRHFDIVTCFHINFNTRNTSSAIVWIHILPTKSVFDCLSPSRMLVWLPVVPRCTRYNHMWYILSKDYEMLVVSSNAWVSFNNNIERHD